MSKKGKLKPDRLDVVPQHKLVMRFLDIKRETINTEQRSVEVVIATENPVERYDEERGIVLHEILEMDGIELRGGRNQLPIVDSHDRSTVGNVLGSVRNLRIDGDALLGDASFARDDRSQEAFQKLVDGHLTDFSITASPKEIGFIERGQEYTTTRGVVVNGPADIVHRWMPTDASLVACGADERSVVRRSYVDIPKEVQRTMDESLIQSLVAMGLPEGLTEPNAILAWVVGNMNAVAPEPAVVEMAETMPDEEKPDDEMMNAEGEEDEMKDDEIKNKVDRALKADRARQKEIRAICAKAGIERAVADALCESDASLDAARKEVLERMADKSKPIGQTVDHGNVRVAGESSQQRLLTEVQAGLIKRSLQYAGSKQTPQNISAEAEGFAKMGLRRLSEMFVRRMGVNTDRLDQPEIARLALGYPGTLARHNITREAYHTTGSFPNLLLDAANKTLLAGYEEAPYTWTIWARQAASVADFKAINRIRFSEMGTPEMVPENHNYPEAKTADSKESYKVEKYGNVFSVTWETVVNDDLDAISRIPAMQGAACRRKQNQAVYSVLTANATMADTGALFNTTAQTTAGGHANLATSAAAPSVTTLNAGFLSMMTKTGMTIDGVAGPILNIQPSYILVPAALSATTLQLVGSIADPSNAAASTEDASRPNYNANVLNIYGPNGSRPLRVVVEPVLDGNSTTAWYLAASTSQVDTVELSFLEGEESPVLENEWDFDKDCYKYKVRQTFGVAAIDFRGLYKNAGA